MRSTLCRISAVLLILTSGCSSSGILGGRTAKGRSSVADAFASTGDSGEAPDRSAAARRSAGATAIAGSSLDPVERRRKVTEHLAAATRAEQAGDVRAARREFE